MANNNSFKKNPTFIIMKRELSSYFTGPIAYIVTGLFLIISGITFFSTYFIQGSAELRGFFGLLPLLFSFFVPALTMRLFAEERRSGSIETLLTLPVTEVNVVAGKFLAAFVEVLVMVSPTLFKGDNLFMLTAQGDSMINAGIFDGDKIVLKQQSYADMVLEELMNQNTNNLYFKIALVTLAAVIIGVIVGVINPTFPENPVRFLLTELVTCAMVLLVTGLYLLFTGWRFF